MIVESTFIRGMNDSKHAIRALHALIETLAPELVILEFLGWEPSSPTGYQWIIDAFHTRTWNSVVVNRHVPMPYRETACSGDCLSSHIYSWEVKRHLKRIPCEP